MEAHPPNPASVRLPCGLKTMIMNLLRVGPPHSGRVAGRRSWVALGVEGRPSVDGVLADEVAQLIAGDAEVLAHFVETDAAPQQLVDSASPGVES